MESARPFVGSLAKCVAFQRVDVIDVALACLLHFSCSHDADVLLLFSQTQLGRRLSVVIREPEKAKEVALERGLLSAGGLKESVLPKAITLLANISHIIEIREQLLGTEPNVLATELLRNAHSRPEILFHSVQILAALFTNEDVHTACTQCDETVPVLLQCFQAAESKPHQDLALGLATFITSTEKGRQVVTQDEENVRKLLSFLLVEREYGDHFSPVSPLLNLARSQLVFGVLVKDSTFLKLLSLWLSKPGRSQIPAVKLLAVLVDDLEEEAVRISMQNGVAEELCTLILRHEDQGVASTVVKIMGHAVLIPEVKRVILQKGEPLWRRFLAFLSNPHTKPTVKSALAVLAELVPYATFSDHGLAVATEAKKLLQSNERDVLQYSALLMSRVLALGTVLLDYDDLVVAMLPAFRSSDMRTLRYASEGFAHISVNPAGNLALSTSPEILSVARRVVGSTQDAETLNAALLMITNMTSNPPIQETLGHNADSKFSGRLLELLSSADSTLLAAAVNILVFVSSNKAGVHSVIFHPLSTGQISSLLESTDRDHLHSALVILARISSLDAGSLAKLDKAHVKLLFVQLKSSRSDNVLLAAQCIASAVAISSCREIVLADGALVEAIFSLLSAHEVSVVREGLQTVFVLAAAENGKAAIKQSEGRVAPVLLSLLCSNDPKTARLACLTFDQLTGSLYFTQTLRSSQKAVNALLAMIGSTHTEDAKHSTRVFFSLAPSTSIPGEIAFDSDRPVLKEAVLSLVQQILSQDKVQKKPALGALTLIMERTPQVKHNVTDSAPFLQLCATGLGSVDSDTLIQVTTILAISVDLKHVHQSLAENIKALGSLISLLKRKGVQLKVLRNVLSILAAVSDSWIPGCHNILQCEEDLTCLLQVSQNGDLACRKSSYQIMLNLSRGGEGTKRLYDMGYLNWDFAPQSEDAAVVALHKEIKKNIAEFEARQKRKTIG